MKTSQFRQESKEIVGTVIPLIGKCCTRKYIRKQNRSYVLINSIRYPHSIVTDQGTNPEFASTVGPPRQSSLIAGQLFALRNAVGHLRNAYNGLDVEWTDVGKYL